MSKIEGQDGATEDTEHTEGETVLVKDDHVTEKILQSALKVSRTLGVGFLEKVYENALMVELSQIGMKASQQKSMQVEYLGQVVGVYVADIIVNDEVIVELKSGKEIEKFHQAQLLNYLKATGLRRGLILNFGTPKLGIKRMVL